MILITKMSGGKGLLLALILGFVSHSFCTEVAPCPGLPSPKHVEVEGCPGAEPCILYNGKGANMNITFESLSNTFTLKPKVRATLGITITYPLPPELQNACNFILNGYCPIEKGETLIYNLNMPLNYPTVTVLLEFSLLADNDEVFQCFKITATVRNQT